MSFNKLSQLEETMNSFSFYNERERTELETFIWNKFKDPIERNTEKTIKLFSWKFKLPVEIKLPIYEEDVN